MNTRLAKAPMKLRINFRVLIFAGVLLLLIGYPVYIYLDSAVHGGIKDVGGGYKELDLKAMSVFPFDQVAGTINDVPKKWRDLDGAKIVVYGEMWQPESAGQYVDSFQLVYSITKCCFNGPPQIQHFVQAKAANNNENLEYYSGLVRVKGTLHVQVKNDGQKVSQVYAMDVQSIEPM
jgi:hypothetical protein